jgi:hypothetical protein
MTAPETRQALQRIRVGMIGLVAVVVLIALASAIMRTATHDSATTAMGGAKPDVVANMVDGNSAADSSGEPLAELGVAPSTGNSAAAAGRAR